MEPIGNVFSIVSCPECNSPILSLEENSIKRKSCASKLHITCQNCKWAHLFWTSKRKQKSFELNRRQVYGMRRICKGHAGASKFCSVMNMPPPPGPKSFKKSSRVIAKHAKTVAKKSMKAAAKEVCVLQQNEDVDGTNL